jgi:micrococcal nuclease
MAAIIPAAILLLTSYRIYEAASRPAPFDFNADRAYRVERVVDGDTLIVEGGHRIRLLGVNTPETKHPTKPVEVLGAEASEFTRNFVRGGQVRLQFDRERRDAVHRVLAFVLVDGRSLNEELIRAGYSRAETRFPYSESMKRRLQKIEEEARSAHRGIWAPATP